MVYRAREENVALCGGFGTNLRSDEDTISHLRGEANYYGVAMPPEEAIRAAMVQADELRIRRSREASLNAFLGTVGKRYEQTTLESFIVTCPQQEKIIAALRDYVASLTSKVEAGVGIVAFGPSGSGKDHLLIGTAREALARDIHVRWVNGRDLFGDFRDAMDSDTAERELLEELLAPAVLIVSDPLPPSAPLSNYQQDVLYRAMDRRYRDAMPTWVSLNVKDGDEANERLGVATVDRLRHNALTLHCNWASYRTPWKQA